MSRWRRLVSSLAVVALVGSSLGFSAVVVEGVAPVGSPVAAPVASAAPVAGGLGYTALASPCRAVDTRNAGGTLVAGGTRDFRMRGSTTFAAQGGSSSGCGVPSTAAAVEVSITAVTPSGASGFVRAFPAGSSVNAAFVNYTVGRGITNTGTVPLNTAVTNDLGVANFGGTIHVIVDIQGYFAPTTGAAYVPLAAPCRVVDTRNAGGTITGGVSRAFQVAGTGANFATQGGTAGGCGVPDGVSTTGVEVSLSVITPTGADGFVRVAPNDGSNPNATFINYTNGTGITNTGTVTLSHSQLQDIIVRNFGGTIHVAVDVQGYFTATPGQGTRYQTVTPCRTVDTRNAGGALAPGQTRTFQTAGDRATFATQGTVNVTGCGVPQRAAAVEASLTAVAPTGAGFTRPGPAGSIAAATFLNYTAVGGITNTGTLPLSLGGLTDLGVTNLGGSASYLIDVLGYYEPPATFPRSAETIDTGGAHTCMIVGGGQVRCWGVNIFGQLGDGTLLERRTPTTVTGITGAVQVSVGLGHSCALLADGTVRCWGSNFSGQIGDGTAGADRLAPATVTGLTGAVQVAAGGDHTCALLDNGTVRCWGRNASGQVGDGTSGNDRPAPTIVSGLAGAVQIAAGGDHTCALLGTGVVRCWGDDFFGQSGGGAVSIQPTPTVVPGVLSAVQVTAGGDHTCVLLVDGTARCWGDNLLGQIGDGASGTDRVPPTVVAGLAGAVRISAGGAHTCALLADGTGDCWGANPSGEIGDGTSGADRPTPVPVSGLSAAVEIATGESRTCALLAAGTASCWGDNTVGQVGDGSAGVNRLSPAAVSGLAGTVQIGTSDEHTCALLGDGSARCWGANVRGQIGDGTSVGSRPVPTAVAGIVGSVQVAAGATFSCGLLGDGTARCWGGNTSGQLGDGTSGTDRLTPVAVSGLAGAVQVTAGFEHTCALLADGGVRCWGGNDDGQVGDGTSGNDRLTPTGVPGLSGVVQVSAGNSHSCALLAVGSVRCWGSNQFGQIGDGTTGGDRLAPTAVPGLAGAVRIAAGRFHTCALIADGTARCWGDNSVGQVGDGTTGASPAPTVVTGLFGAVGIAAGGGHNCAVLTDGTVQCWGNDQFGQIGDGTTGGNQLTPTTAPGLTGAVRVSAGRDHTCVVLAAGTASCWGDNAVGQVGDTTTGNVRPAPVPVVDLP